METDKKRIGLIAQEVLNVLPSEFQNIVGACSREDSDGNKTEMYGLDYGRLGSCVLWAVCKNQQKRLDQIEVRLAALESKKTKKQ